MHAHSLASFILFPPCLYGRVLWSHAGHVEYTACEYWVLASVILSWCQLMSVDVGIKLQCLYNHAKCGLQALILTQLTQMPWLSMRGWTYCRTHLGSSVCPFLAQCILVDNDLRLWLCKFQSAVQLRYLGISVSSWHNIIEVLKRRRKVASRAIKNLKKIEFKIKIVSQNQQNILENRQDCKNA